MNFNQTSNITHFTVSRVAEIIKNTLEQTFPVISIIGEVSNLAISKKYAFFSLKDDDALIKCVSWNPSKLNISEGESIIATGKITAYKNGSYYQLTVFSITKQGQGNLAKQFETLKLKLQSEGIFDQKHKKPIPIFTQKIAIISAKNSAALEDILINIHGTILEKTYIIPAVMQGNNCVSSVVLAQKKAQKLSVDVIIIARGGGSFEDLNSFNDEVLAREVFACSTPVISAIGHEIDFTILDFVADIRAATPTAAAKMVSQQKTEVLFKIQAHRRTILDRTRFEVHHLRNKIAISMHKISSDMYSNVQEIRHRIEIIQYKLSKKSFINILKNKKQTVEVLAIKLEKINTKNILEQGFAMLTDDTKFYDNPKDLPKDFQVITKHGQINVMKKW